MTRSPLFYPLNRGMDAEAGGVADLQTDVMRFIAILALCLVAIFALVQSIPLLPTTPPPQAPQAERIETPVPLPKTLKPATPETAEPKPIVEPDPLPVTVEERPEEKPLLITRPAPQRMPKRQVPQRIVEQAIPANPVETTEPQPTSESQAIDSVTEDIQHTVVEPVPAQSQGFTLRFETDLALTRLVARNEVGLYAITPEKSLRMNVNRGTLSFWAASVPNQYHEMDQTTVPDDVLSALSRAGHVNAADVKWGVTLPKKMRNKLDQYLSAQDGGSLIISGDGSLRLEP